MKVWYGILKDPLKMMAGNMKPMVEVKPVGIKTLNTGIQVHLAAFMCPGEFNNPVKHSAAELL